MVKETEEKEYTIFWFRRDLRLYDNKGLYFALKENHNVLPLFIFDNNITQNLSPKDARIEFILKSINEIQRELNQKHKSLWIQKGNPLTIFKKLTSEYSIKAVYTNKDHEPYGIKRDEEIVDFLRQKQIKFHSFLDHLLFDKTEVVKNDHTPYHVFTPFSKKCMEVLTDEHFAEYPSEHFIQNLGKVKNKKPPTLAELGFKTTGISFPSAQHKEAIIDNYHQTRDYPGREGTTRLGVHLRFGTVSLRQLSKYAYRHNSVFFNELLWREFYAMILWNYPHVVSKSFKPNYDHIPWRNNEEEFELWKAGRTGYPIVDAGMHELLQTGYIHNRVRMITASFLTKHLLIDWRWGEAWFAELLLDYELSNNNGGWQWSAGSGCDAAPYFRIFNPTEQQRKFDPKASYIKQWLKGFTPQEYLAPIVEHKFARERCLNVYKMALNNSQ